MKKIIMFFIAIISMVIFGMEEMRAPNEIITSNPEREVTTVESLKTRDHATMSLSVTKVVPEEVIGRLSNGKLLVTIPIPKKQTKIFMKPENFKLKAYSNPIKTFKPVLSPKNLTVEDIRKMKKGVSNEKVIKVKEKNDEEVVFEIDNVTTDEKIYFSINYGEKLLKSYKVNVVNSRKKYDHWWAEYNGNLMESEAKNQFATQIYGDEPLILDGSNNVQYPIVRQSINPNNMAVKRNRVIGVAGITSDSPNSNTKLEYKDEFFNDNYQLTGYKIKPEDSGMVFFPYNTSKRHQFIIDNTLNIIFDIGGTVQTSSGQSKISKVKHFFEISSGIITRDTIVDFYEEKAYLNSYNKELLKRIKKIKTLSSLEEGYYNARDERDKRFAGIPAPPELTYLNRTWVDIQVVYTLGITMPAKGRVGAYEVMIPRVRFNYKYPVESGDSFEIKTYSTEARNIKALVDVSDSGEKNFTKSIIASLNQNYTITDHAFDDNMGLSNVKKVTDNNLGIFRKNGSSYQRLAPNSKITINNSQGSSIELIQRQGQNQFATYDVKLIKRGTNDTKPQFKFTLVQGKKFKSNDDNKEKFIVHRTINFTLNYPEIKDAGKFELDLDPRLQQLVSNNEAWVRSNGAIGGLASNEIFSEMLSTKNDNITLKDKSFTSSIQIGDLIKLKDKENEFEVWGSGEGLGKYNKKIATKAGTLGNLVKGNMA